MWNSTHCEYLKGLNFGIIIRYSAKADLISKWYTFFYSISKENPYMKKILIMLIFCLGSINLGFSQNGKVEAINKNESVLSDGFVLLQESEVEKSIIQSITERFEKSELIKIYVNKQNDYKVELINAKDKKQVVYLDEKGNWIYPKYENL